MILTGVFARGIALAAGYDDWYNAISYNEETGELVFGADNA